MAPTVHPYKLTSGGVINIQTMWQQSGWIRTELRIITPKPKSEQTGTKRGAAAWCTVSSRAAKTNTNKHFMVSECFKKKKNKLIAHDFAQVLSGMRRTDNQMCIDKQTKWSWVALFLFILHDFVLFFRPPPVLLFIWTHCDLSSCVSRMKNADRQSLVSKYPRVLKRPQSVDCCRKQHQVVAASCLQPLSGLRREEWGKVGKQITFTANTKPWLPSRMLPFVLVFVYQNLNNQNVRLWVSSPAPPGICLCISARHQTYTTQTMSRGIEIQSRMNKHALDFTLTFFLDIRFPNDFIISNKVHLAFLDSTSICFLLSLKSN